MSSKPVKPRPAQYDGMPVDRPVQDEKSPGCTHVEGDFQGFAAYGFLSGLGGDREIGKAKGDRLPQHSAPQARVERRSFVNVKGRKL